MNLVQSASVILSLLTTILALESGNWTSCRDLLRTPSLSPCLCRPGPEQALHVNCDGVVFGSDFPSLRQPMTSFSHRHVKTLNVPPGAFVAGSGLGLQTLDLSHNWLRRLAEKSLDGLSESLVHLNLSHNVLGDQLNPIFSTAEFRRLPRLRVLSLAHNQIATIDGGILDGSLSLQELWLEGNELEEVPSAALKGPNALRRLHLGNNLIQELKAEAFTLQPSLLSLNLSHNRIGGIEGNAFGGLANLKVLDLASNRLHRLNSDPFNGLGTLEDLDLSNNFLSQVPATALRLISTLRRLSLAANLIHSLDPVALQGLGRLSHLDLSRNRIADIPPAFFKPIRSLRTLNLGVNLLRTIPGGTFEALDGLRELSLLDNNLLTFPTSALAPLLSLTSLSLDYNRISALTPSPLSNLTRLTLANNLIRDIPAPTFLSFPLLRHLDLEGNLLQTLDDLRLPPSLTSLRLPLNRLPAFPRLALPLLRHLDLSGNALARILAHNFVLLPNLTSLLLAGNGISEMAENSLDGLERLAELDLSGNAIQRLPLLSSLPRLRMLNLSRNAIKEVGTLEGGEGLEVLDLSHNPMTNLPAAALGNRTHLRRLDLRGNQLNSFRGLEGTLQSLEELQLDDNAITYIYPSSFSNLEGLRELSLSGNGLRFFPTEFLRQCRALTSLSLARNQIKTLNEMSFSDFNSLRSLDLSENGIEFLPSSIFRNSSQLQILNLSANKIENVDPDFFHGLFRLELDLSNNYLSHLPLNMFERSRVMRLQKVNLGRNTFEEIPWEALQKQYFYLEELSLAENGIRQVPPNLNILVNVKTLDLSSNPLSPASLKHLLNEPKTARHLSLAKTALASLPLLEMPFLRSLNLSGNPLTRLEEGVFRRTTLLKALHLQGSSYVEGPFPPSLTSLDLSGTPLAAIKGKIFPPALSDLRLNGLEGLSRVETTALHLKHLERLEVSDCPKLGYLDIRGLLTNLHYLTHFEFEVKDTQILDQLHPGLNPRVSHIGLSGRRVRSISTGAFAGLNSPSVRISLTNTSLTVLPSILVPVPMSSWIVLDVSGSRISNLSPPFLSERIRLEGLSPVCDCNALNLINYIQRIRSDVRCSGPRSLDGARVLALDPAALICESGSSTSTTPLPVPPTLSTTTTADDIIWSLPPATGRPSRRPATDRRKETVKEVKTEITNMDNLIIGIVGGVVGLILLFVLLIVCFVRLSGGGGGGHGPDRPEYGMGGGSVMSVPAYAASSKCTCPHKSSEEQGGRMHVGGGQGQGGILVPASYATLRGPGGHAKSPGGGIYAIHPGHYGGGGRGGGTVRLPPQPMSMVGHGQYPAQPMYASLPYFLPEDYERR